jgi:hypothetical protein
MERKAYVKPKKAMITKVESEEPKTINPIKKEVCKKCLEEGKETTNPDLDFVWEHGNLLTCPKSCGVYRMAHTKYAAPHWCHYIKEHESVE